MVPHFPHGNPKCDCVRTQGGRRALARACNPRPRPSLSCAQHRSGLMQKQVSAALYTHCPGFTSYLYTPRTKSSQASTEPPSHRTNVHVAFPVCGSPKRKPWAILCALLPTTVIYPEEKLYCLLAGEELTLPRLQPSRSQHNAVPCVVTLHIRAQSSGTTRKKRTLHRTVSTLIRKPSSLEGRTKGAGYRFSSWHETPPSFAKDRCRLRHRKRPRRRRDAPDQAGGRSPAACTPPVAIFR